jgi:hypothetical protein
MLVGGFSPVSLADQVGGRLDSTTPAGQPRRVPATTAERRGNQSERELQRVGAPSLTRRPAARARTSRRGGARRWAQSTRTDGERWPMR